MKFSERFGFTKPRDFVQIDSMDDALRNRLWNLIDLLYFPNDIKHRRVDNVQSDFFHFLYFQIWDVFFKKHLADRPDYVGELCNHISNWFENSAWFDRYNFLEFLSNEGFEYFLKHEIYFNDILENEFSAYRFIQGQLVQISNEQELVEIESALESKNTGAKNHLQTALGLYSNRKNPDYRNSIKESISAVESMAQMITGKPKATLGDSIKELRKKIEIHPSLEAGFNKIYGYTSNAQGIRHGMQDEPNLSQEDARYMLVSCSAFINYLTVKAQKAGIF